MSSYLLYEKLTYDLPDTHLPSYLSIYFTFLFFYSRDAISSLDSGSNSCFRLHLLHFPQFEVIEALSPSPLEKFHGK